MPLAKQLKTFLIYLYRLISQVIDPIVAIRGIANYFKFIVDWQRYKMLPGAEHLNLRDAYPQLHDCTATTAIDFHYYYTNGWAIRRVVATSPSSHTDISSQVIFSNLLASVIPVEFLDYRPIKANLSGLRCTAGNILELPYNDQSLASVSCLHVIEHIGLGRYGDPLDPAGSMKAANELVRVLAANGNLFLAVPVGRSRVCFNAHRVHSAHEIVKMFTGLELIEFSGVHDDGRFVERVGLDEFSTSEYACGFFWFKKS